MTREIDKLLKYIQRTNDCMTMERLVEELEQNQVATVCLLMVYVEEKDPEYRGMSIDTMV